MITYDSNAKVFHLQTNETSYLILLYQDQIPMHVYWGKRMRSSEAAWYVQAPYRRSSIVANRHPDDPKFSAEYYPFEYPSYGGTDYRAPAYEVRDQNGYTLCDPRFESYRIFEGKPDLEGLPSLHDTKNETQTLELVLFDQVLGLRIRLYYTVFEQHDVITRHTVFENAGEQTLQLQEALSASMDFKHAPDRMLQLTGTALRERHLIERSLTQGTVTVDSTRGISSHQAARLSHWRKQIRPNRPAGHMGSIFATAETSLHRSPVICTRVPACRLASIRSTSLGNCSPVRPLRRRKRIWSFQPTA